MFNKIKRENTKPKIKLLVPFANYSEIQQTKICNKQNEDRLEN